MRRCPTRPFVTRTQPLPERSPLDAQPVDAGPPDVAPAGCTDAACDDGIDCTLDRCDLTTMTCLHTPRSSLCPAGFVCDLALGCTAGAFAVSTTTLYSANLPSGAITSVGPTGVTMFDVALEPDGTLYGVDSLAGLWTIDTNTGAATRVAMVGEQLNALDAAPDGFLYAAGGPNVYSVDPKTGAQTFLLTYPDGYASSGDVAMMQGMLMATV